MAIINETALKQKLKGGNCNLYILLGDDSYLKQMYAKKIGSTTAAPDDIFNYQKFTGDSDLQDVYDAVLQFPMMSEKKFVCLTDYDFEGCSKSDFDKLCTILTETPDTCVFVMVFDALQIAVKKNNKLTKLVTAAEKNNGVAVELNHRTVPELVKMLTSGANKRGCRFDSAAARYLIETVGEDINTLKNEMEKLCAYSNKGEITKQTIESVCAKTVEANIYNLSKQIIECNMPNAIKLLDELFYLKVEPIIILSTISGFYVDMYRAFLGKDRGLQSAAIADDFGYKGREFVVRNAIADSKRFDNNKFNLSFDALRKADKALKSFSSNPRTILEQLVVRLSYIAVKGECLD